MKRYKPITPSRRQAIKEDFSLLSKEKPEKKLIIHLKKKSGRNNQGRITCRHKGGGAKKKYRLIDFGESKKDIPAKVLSFQYDPYRTSFIALVQYEGGEKGYILAPQGLKIGDEIISSDKAEIKPGNRMRLKNIPLGTDVYNIEFEPNTYGKLVRAAGSSAKVLACENGWVNLKMPSGEIRKVSEECFASVGVVSRPEHKYVKLGKAGKSRYKGRRPEVRGTAMSVNDHPHGGGEGRTGVGMPGPKTPWGKPAFGVKTRKRKSTNKYIIKIRKRK